MKPTRDEAVIRVRRELARLEGLLEGRRAHHDAEVRTARAAVERLQERLDANRAAIERAVSSEGEGAGAGERLGRIAERFAPGSASAPWDQWPPDPQAPDAVLYRIGTMHRLVRPATSRRRPADDEQEGDEAGWPLPATPALVPVLGRGQFSVSSGASRTGAEIAESVVRALLLRLLAAKPPGSVLVSLYDPRHLGARLGGLHALARPGLLTSYAPHEFDLLIRVVTREIRRIQETVLAGRFANLDELHAGGEKRPEPWRLIVIHAPPGGFSDEQTARLNSIAHAGPACGIHLLCCDVTFDDTVTAEQLRIRPDGLARLDSMPAFLLRPDPAPPEELVRSVCEHVVVRAGEVAPRGFNDLLPPEPWRESSAAGLRAPVGDELAGETPVEVSLGDDPPHALVGGPSGAGKTNFLYVLIGSLAARYDPDELEFYLLDFKEGVSFARFASGRKDPSWLPHARLVGININSDREFGLALLRYLAEQLRVRASAAKEHEVTKLEELRREDPATRWPRIVAVIDEFQILLAQRDKITEESVALLEDLARRGRSQGIHLVLASQDITGVEALWGRSSIFAQFTLRIALPKARRILADDNRAAERIPRYCAVVNPDSGLEMANRTVRIPDAGAAGTVDALQRELWHRRPDHLPAPTLFDGGEVPALADVAEFTKLAPTGSDPVAMVGQVIDLAGSPARMRFARAPGRNLAVIGNRQDEACDIIGSAVLSLARQHATGTATFTVVCLDAAAAAAADGLRAALGAAGHDVRRTDSSQLRDVLSQAAERVRHILRAGVDGKSRHYLVMLAVDAASTLLGEKDAASRTSGLDLLRTIVQRGPETNTHLLGWWRTAARLKDDLAGLSPRVDDVGGWVALDAQVGELAALPGGSMVTWAPRRRRALFFDRAIHDRPHPVIPYRLELPATQGRHDDRPYAQSR